MKKLIVVLIFVAAYYHYQNGHVPLKVLPDIDINKVAAELSRQAESGNVRKETIQCPRDQYVAVDRTLSSATCKQRTQL